VVEHSALATAQLRVSLATIAPGAVLRAKTRATNAWVIALDSADAGKRLVLRGAGSWVGGTYRAAPGWAVSNRGQSSIRVIVVSQAR
jgi:hypothetical protein